MARAWVLMGVPGAGKTTVARRLRSCTGAEHIDPDSVPADWRARFHDTQLARRAARDRRLEACLGRNRDLIWDGTGRNLGEYAELLQRLRRHGYRTELVLVTACRPAARPRVPDGVKEQAARSVGPNFRTLSKLADAARVVGR